jgi:hypothetical protein
MELTFCNLTAADLRGGTLGELLVHIEADFGLRDGDRDMYSERLFPVAELAIELVDWISGSDGRGDFRFRSLSFEEDGAVIIAQTPEGWVGGSVFDSESWSAPVNWQQLRDLIADFVRSVRRGVAGLGIDPSFISEPERSR